MVELRLVIALLALTGGFAGFKMLERSAAASAGRLAEPSVVELPEARLFFGIPNAAFGLAYYALAFLAVATSLQILLVIATAASVVALATSIYLAVKLVRQQLECSRCWTAHAVNALLCPLLIAAATMTR